MSREFVGYIVPDSIYDSIGYDKRTGRVIWNAPLEKYSNGAYLYAREEVMKKQTPLADDELRKLIELECGPMQRIPDMLWVIERAIEIARAVERAHGIK